ncbi:QRFP-like peptide receptor isoform X2 [Artemia franciscana]|uniref:QRFP-like peptide receptor isoform X2 n=1 Tax=Artemia franciscana TaxID=6661 RepID=UPI0032DB3F62
MDVENELSLGNQTADYVYEYDIDASVPTEVLVELIATTLVYVTVFILGLFGNILIIITVSKYRRMKSVTNLFLVSLSSADLLVITICVPLKLVKLYSFSWTLGLFLCKFIHYLQMYSAICSVLTLTALSLERYYAILHPLRAKTLCTTSHTRRMIIGIWLISLFLALPTWHIQVIKEVGVRFPAFWCTRDYDNTITWRVISIFHLFLLLIIPSYIMGMTYMKIGTEIWKMAGQRAQMTNNTDYESRNAEIQSSPNSGDAENKQKHRTPRFHIKITYSSKGSSLDTRNVKQLIKMLVTVVVIFIVCWTPYLIDEVLTAFDHLSLQRDVGISRVTYTFVQLLAYTNSCVNPVIYGFMSRNFRSSMISALKCNKCGRNKSKMTLGRQPTSSVKFTETAGIHDNMKHRTGTSNLMLGKL